jgi:hypothetical protein
MILALSSGVGLIGLGLGLWHWWGHGTRMPPPPRGTVSVVPPATSSSLVVPVSADLAALDRLLDRAIPTDLWQIDQPGVTCVAPQHLHLFGGSVAITPKLHCHITGKVVRGPIVLHGSGQTIVADVPILAHVDATQIGGLVNAHADGQAMAHARITLAIARDWQPHGTVALSYDWTSPPTVDVLGQQIDFTDKADARLKPVIADLERKLPATLARLDLRSQIDGLWRGGFAVLKLNDSHPSVWMRVVPQALSYGGYTIADHRLQLRLGLVALTQAVVGQRPTDPAPTPLPDMAPPPGGDGKVHLFVPVIADYAELVPVITRALARRSARPFDLPAFGAVDTLFSNIAVYGASQGRIAVGADVQATPRNGLMPSTRGRIWFAGRPHNDPGSQVVRFSDLTVSGSTDSARGALLMALANNPGFSDVIAGVLTQNFTNDFAKLQGKIQHAIADRQQGEMHIDATLESTRNATLSAYANGLYMPVQVTGRASVAYAPRRMR